MSSIYTYYAKYANISLTDSLKTLVRSRSRKCPFLLLNNKRTVSKNYFVSLGIKFNLMFSSVQSLSRV